MMGRFITVEGPDGAGKTTQVKKIYNYLLDLGKKVIITREPGGTELGENLRKVLLTPDDKAPVPEAEALIYAASRVQLVKKVIKPALAQGFIVLSDRFIDSNLAYQGWARGLGIDEIIEINNWSLKDCMPDITFVLDIDPKVSLKRKKDKKDRLESETLDFHRKVREGFLVLKERFSDRIKILDARKNEYELFRDILSEIEKSGIL